MATAVMRGSEKVIAAWNSRVLSEESIGEIAKQFEESPATVETADVIGGAQPTGLRVSLRYDGEDGPWCGNDILFWLKWHLGHGGVVKPPKIIINGIPFPDLVRMELDFGHVGEHVPSIEDISGELALGELGA
jgi:hypothetical protein